MEVMIKLYCKFGGYTRSWGLNFLLVPYGIDLVSADFVIIEEVLCFEVNALTHAQTLNLSLQLLHIVVLILSPQLVRILVDQ